jgi:hypothetical protein
VSVEDVTVLDGGLTFDEPVIVLDLATARRAITEGEIALIVHEAAQALELSGKRVVYVRETE